MKTPLIVLIVLFASFNVAAQSPQDSTKTGNETFIPIEVPAQYPGGMKALSKFVNKELKFPRDAVKAKRYGTVYIQFIIDAAGAIEDSIVVLKSVYPSLDSEAVRVVKQFPKWIPGQQKGVPTRTRFVLPVTFKPPKVYRY